ncbi:MAG: hypothetical protein HYT82_02475 [Candidatus Harrisonbacteria bacterium]|nr:hypothetical protein [Candidatus Harrisonbacteria bacterium]
MQSPEQRRREHIGSHSPVHRRGEKMCDGKKVELYQCEACKTTSTKGRLLKMRCPKAPPKELEGHSADDAARLGA